MVYARLSAWLPFALVAAACSFPSVTFAPADAASGADGGDAAADADAADAATDGAPPDSNDPCDRDGDGYKAEGTCGGLDCDDDDARANPGVTQFQTYAPQAPTNGDWNCDGHVAKRYGANVSCNVAQIGAACDGVVGFAADPPCGGAGTLDHCKTQGLLCAVDTQESALQGCL